MHNRQLRFLAVTFALICVCQSHATAGDWPMLGLNGTRNAVSPEKGAPLDWSIGTWDALKRRWDSEKARNIKWRARLGGLAGLGSPSVAGGRVFIGTNGSGGHIKLDPREGDTVWSGYLHCFRASDGKFLWRYRAKELENLGWRYGHPGLGSSPLVEGNRLWLVSNRGEVLCLDTEGFRDKQNDGPYKEEKARSSIDADIVWRHDLIKQSNVYPYSHLFWNANRQCSPVAYGNRLYVVTGNGRLQRKKTIPSPKAPSLICFDKRTGKVLWTDASPGGNILRGQFGDPTIIKIKGRAQVVVGQGDGWVRSFDAVTGKLIWKFDINRKAAQWGLGSLGTRNSILTSPVFYKGRIYIGSGRVNDFDHGPGRLVCIDATKTGDISSELAVDARGRAVPPRRFVAIDPKKGEKAIPNPNSGLIWEFTRTGKPKKGEDDFLKVLQRTTSNVVIKDGMLIAVDSPGKALCFDADTGKRHWACDLISSVAGSPLIIENWVYIPDNDGTISIFRLSADPDRAMKKVKGEYRPRYAMVMDSSINGSPVFANGVLYVASNRNLWAIAGAKRKGAGNRRSPTAKKK